MNKFVILICLTLICSLSNANDKDATNRKLTSKSSEETKDEFLRMIMNKIHRNYIAPDIVKKADCMVRFELSLNGAVSNIDTSDCIVEELAVSATSAIKHSVPLPVSKDPEVFEILKNVTIKFSKN